MTPFIWNVPLGKSIEGESRLVVVPGWGGLGEMRIIAHGHSVSVWGDENILKLIVLIVAQFFEYTKTHWIKESVRVRKLLFYTVL